LLLLSYASHRVETPDDPQALGQSTQGGSFLGALAGGQLIKDDKGRFSYYLDGELQSRFGIDVSVHQGSIDWQAVAADGVEFAIIRIGYRGATEGNLYVDTHYEENIRGAAQAGIQTGVYFFSQAINMREAREEAEFVLQHLGGRQLDYPIAFDHERVPEIDGRANRITGAQISRYAEAFFQIIEEAGYEVLLYGNKGDLNRLDNSLLDSHDLWYAEYEVASPSFNRDILIWQYSSHGHVNGIPNRTDLNIHFLP